MKLCDICRVRPAAVKQRHTGKALCYDCFIKDVQSRVKSEITRYNMIMEGDRILVGVSGGKDSLVLLDVLASVYSPSKLMAITIVEGIRGYNREVEVEFAKKLSKSLGVDHEVVYVKDFLGYSVDDFARAAQLLEIKVSPCTYCGIARRRIMNVIARERGLNKVATGHQLDDESQTVLINFLRGDIMRLIQLHPLSEVHSSKLIKRIKPLRKIYEYETALYAYIKGFHLQEAECPYIVYSPTMRVKVREVLSYLENLAPGLLLRFLDEFDEYMEHLVLDTNRKRIDLPLCFKCGEPTAPGRSLCKFCELVDQILSASMRIPPS